MQLSKTPKTEGHHWNWQNLVSDAQDTNTTIHIKRYLVYRTITEKFPAKPDENAQALRLIEQWTAEAPTDPEQIREAEGDRHEFQRGINQTLRDAGARRVYSELEKRLVLRH